MSHPNASVKSIVFALLANLGIAITKTVAAVITGSGAMLADSDEQLIEAKLRKLNPSIQWIFFEPDVED